MIDNFFYSVAETLKGIYPNSDIYINATEQDVIDTDFFIVPISVNLDNIRGKWWALSIKLDVQYMTSSRMDAMTVGANLFDNLEYIKYIDDEKPLRGYNMNYRYYEGILHFMIDYDLYLRGTIDKDVLMKNLKSKGYIKEE